MAALTTYRIHLEIDAVSDLGTRLSLPQERGLQSCLLTVTSEALKFETTCFGVKCCAKPFLVRLAQVASNKKLVMPSIQQGMVLQLEQSEEVSLLLKIFVSGDISRLYTNIEAQRRLAQGEVLITGWLDPTKPLSQKAISFLPAGVAIKILNARAKLDSEKVDMTAKIMLGSEFSDGIITLTKKKIGVEMFRNVAGEPKGSVFCFAVSTDEIILNVTNKGTTEEPVWETVLPGTEKVFIDNLKADLPFAAILAAPYRSEAAKTSGTTFTEQFTEKGTAVIKAVKRSVSLNRSQLKGVKTVSP
eukprot:CAMPEP_0119322360 /NCGR_PEP_ID=MMETSP1333-20130426/57986_1 /TAXON_ID=418940 /ORGANISM="Scyphosphaera apsteinii, Strain RCC1455" /LENGTH=301 /DNA_ID=CAMNT_0007329575 /DNA_START=110 /DNA_END=1015 /DNA_ORIENTATION=+